MAYRPYHGVRSHQDPMAPRTSGIRRFMPAKGLTLTLMANARRVAAQAVRDLAAEEASSS